MSTVMMRLTFKIGIICLCMGVIETDSNESIHSDNNITAQDECLTKSCRVDRLRGSLSILLYMNESVSPCDNFYEFVCGNYEQVSSSDNNMPFKLIQKYSDHIINENLYHSIRRMNATSEKSRPRKLVKEFFDMCMDTETRDYRSTKSLMEIIDKLYGWPLLEGDKWNDSNWKWENVYNEAIKLGVPTDSFMLNVKPYVEYKNHSISLAAHPPKTEFQTERLSHPRPQDKAIDAYYDFMMNVVLKGFNIPPSKAISELENVINFEKLLSQKSSTMKWLEGQIIQFRDFWPNTTWDTVFNLTVYGIEIDNITEPIRVMSYEHLQFISNPIPKRLLANYQIQKFVQYAVPYLSSKFVQMKKDFIKTRYGVEASVDDRWESCVRDVRKSLPHIADAIFFQDYFDKDIKREVMEMVENIKEQFMKTLNSISWLDESSREWAVTKLNSTRYLIAYPDEAYDHENLDKLYKDYEIVNGDYLKTVLRFNYLSQKRIMMDYKTYNQSGYKELSSWIGINAFNDAIKNTIQILAGILQDNTYNKNRPKYINYGIVGRMIAHEMSHNFDLSGRYYDKDGYFDSAALLNATVQSIYDNRTSCLMEEYSKYKYPKINLPVNGTSTVNENMADVNGIRLAYHAYQQWVRNHGPEVNLPYLNYTPNQLYWISFAHPFCTAYTVQGVIDGSYDTHATYDVRVKGSVSNSPEFAADFNCPINSKMNPIHKCTFF